MAGVDIPAHMQGRAFLSEQKEEPRNYVVAHRDRFDESYDMMRSVRDKKYRYVRNYYTNQPYVQWIPYRNNSPIMEELLRLHADDKLEGALGWAAAPGGRKVVAARPGTRPLPRACQPSRRFTAAGTQH